jgi:hypothetical protein
MPLPLLRHCPSPPAPKWASSVIDLPRHPIHTGPGKRMAASDNSPSVKPSGPTHQDLPPSLPPPTSQDTSQDGPIQAAVASILVKLNYPLAFQPHPKPSSPATGILWDPTAHAEAEAAHKAEGGRLLQARLTHEAIMKEAADRAEVARVYSLYRARREELKHKMMDKGCEDGRHRSLRPPKRYGCNSTRVCLPSEGPFAASYLRKNYHLMVPL